MISNKQIDDVAFKYDLRPENIKQLLKSVDFKFTKDGALFQPEMSESLIKQTYKESFVNDMVIIGQFVYATAYNILSANSVNGEVNENEHYRLETATMEILPSNFKIDNHFYVSISWSDYILYYEDTNCIKFSDALYNEISKTKYKLKGGQMVNIMNSIQEMLK